jgi:RHH-type proline utilization regulon transcriptional repressor/proline dehydrogenase/delta 1-pyrroline-5-carboxylate dehydrogenase
MRADHLKHAISLVDATPYGLTSGLHSLDEREQQFWMQHIEAGNCYINRGITGAIVGRQPFGGCKQSSFGPGIKAGGPNTLTTLMIPEQISLPLNQKLPPESFSVFNALVENSGLEQKDIQLWHASVKSYLFYWKNLFSLDHDFFKILGQSNIFRYVPYKQIILRLTQKDSLLDIFRVIAATQITNTPLQISGESFNLLAISPHMQWIKETECEFIKRLSQGDNSHVRLLSPPSKELIKALADAACHVSKGPVIANGRIELLNYMREVSFSIDDHRYGYIYRT